jgi:hypothetical protein
MTTSSHLPSGDSNDNGNTRATHGKIIDLIPAGRSTFADAAFKWLRGLVIAGLVIVLAFMLLRVVVALVVAVQISDAVGRSAQAAGLDAGITSWLQTVASFGLGLGAVGLVARAALGFLFPFGKAAAGSWKPLAALIAASGIGTVLPVGIQHVRGVDEAGLPAVMSEVDPADHAWFSPKGEALIFYADHLDGQRRFWNRPGSTPRDSMMAQPVTATTHGEWLRQQLEAGRAEAAARQAREATAAEEARRQAAETAAQAERERRQQEHDQAIARLQQQIQEAEARRAEAERQQAQIERQRMEVQRELEQQQAAARRAQQEPAGYPAPDTGFRVRVAENQAPAWNAPRPQIVQESPAVPEVREFPLRPGATFWHTVNGERVMIWSDGPIAASADHFNFRAVPEPGRTLAFSRGAQTIHVRPLNRSATKVFVQKMED